MRQNKEKSEFLNELKTEIKNAELLTVVFNTTFQDVLNAFDGKVYNKRFINALNDKLKEVSPLLYAAEDGEPRKDSYSNYKDDKILHIKLLCRFDAWNYTRNQIIYTNLVLSSSSYRIDAQKSRTEKYTISWFENFRSSIDEKKGVIKCYDKYIKMAAKLSGIIDDFGKLPIDFRKNITFNNLYYLK